MINRRRFLQFTGSALATCGLSQLEMQHQSIRYAQALGQPTRRKKALLVGVNQYKKNPRLTDLKGCIADVQRQQQLLIGRFGFHPNDVLTLTDETPQKPIREAILSAFEDHLIRNTQPNDVVVFHFSGHGSRLTDPTPVRLANGELEQFNSALVPSPNDSLQEADIMGRSLFLLMSALNTENVTVVLDCCYSGGGTRGNARVRSIPRDRPPSEIELAYQQRWLTELAINPEEFSQRRNLGVAKGVVIAAARRNQEALDITFGNDVHTGAFTGFLTQYLWQQTDSVQTIVTGVSRSLEAANLTQSPLQDVKANSSFEQQPIYFIDKSEFDTTQAAPADALLTEVQGQGGSRGKIWLGGVDPDKLIAFEAGATFTSVTNQSAGDIKLLSRNGLVGKVLLSGTIAPGTLLQEATRVIPRDLRLRIGLDPSLGAEAVQVQQKLRSLRRIEPVLAQTGDTPYGGGVQYILSRMTPQYRQLFQQAPPAAGSVGLFSQSLDEIIPASFGESNESVEQAIDRLSPKFAALVAARIVKLMLNGNSSRLSIEAAIEREDQAAVLVGQSFTVRGSVPASVLQSTSRQINVGSPFRFRVVNRESQPLYVSILIIAPTGEISVLFPNQFTAAEDTTQIAAGQTLLLPDADKNDPFKFVPETPGIGEALIIASRSPLRQALLALRTLAIEQQLPEQRGFVAPSVEAIGDLLSDLSGNRGNSGAAVSAQLSVSEMAALSITFEVV
ncbi:caspase family protein [Phormidium tenue FACHB-886]|nr:caspase family protein [Phormidium tenue FACHB-886]